MIGILGGMGPLATVNFYRIFINVVTNKYGVKENHEFPSIIIDNIPVKFPKFDINTGSSPGIDDSVSMIKEGIDRLNKIGVKIYGMPCNTFHLYTEEFRKYIGNRGRFISMVDETVDQVKNDGYKKIGILGTETTINLLLYEDKFDKNYSIYKVSDLDKRRTVEIIESVISGKILEKDINTLKELINDLYSQGAECIILGCTELPVIAEKISNPPIKLYNPMEILANKISDSYFN